MKHNENNDGGGSFALVIGTVKADNWTAEEKALLAKGDVMESYITSKPDSRQVGYIQAKPGGPRLKVLILNFGSDSAATARAKAREMRAFKYTPAMAEQFLFAEAWSLSRDRFYTRCYIQEGLAGYAGN